MRYRKDILIFLGIWIILYLVTLNNLIFPDFDWFNYRFYNCWAFLNDRMQTDFFASNFRTCFNPLLDLPEYFLMFKLNNYPYLFLFVTLFDNTLLLYLVYKISQIIFKGRYLCVYSLLYVAVSPVLLLETNFAANDVKVAILCLLSLYLLLKSRLIVEKRNFLLAGILLGISLGLKLTSIVYVVTFYIILALFHKKFDSFITSLMLFTLGLFLAYLFTGGIWMMKCFWVYHNPVFPYFNNIFKSNFADNIMLLNTDFSHLKARNIVEFIFYPFYQSVGNRFFGTEKMAWDLRYAMNFISVIGIFSLMFFNKFKVEKVANKELYFVIVLMTIIPYYLNLFVFGSYRYIIPSSCLFGIVIVGLIFTILKERFAFVFSLILLVSVYCFCNYGQLDRVFEYNKIYNKNISPITLDFKKIIKSQDLGFEDGSFVILLNARSSASVVGQNKNVKYLGFSYPEDLMKKYENLIEASDPFLNVKVLKSKYLENEIQNILSGKNKVYALYASTKYPEFLKRGLMYLDKDGKRTFKNCKWGQMQIYDSFFWSSNVIVCEFN